MQYLTYMCLSKLRSQFEVTCLKRMQSKLAKVVSLNLSKQQNPKLLLSILVWHEYVQSTVESESVSIWLFQPGRNAKRLAEIECKKAISTQAPRSQSTIIHRKVQQHNITRLMSFVPAAVMQQRPRCLCAITRRQLQAPHLCRRNHIPIRAIGSFASTQCQERRCRVARVAHVVVRHDGICKVPPSHWPGLWIRANLLINACRGRRLVEAIGRLGSR